MFIHMLTVECTNRLCSNMSNTIQHCSLRCKGHKIIIICIIMNHCTCPVTILGLLICLILTLISHSTQLICFYANYKHMQQCLACARSLPPWYHMPGCRGQIWWAYYCLENVTICYYQRMCWWILCCSYLVLIYIRISISILVYKSRNNYKFINKLF